MWDVAAHLIRHPDESRAPVLCFTLLVVPDQDAVTPGGNLVGWLAWISVLRAGKSSTSTVTCLMNAFDILFWAAARLLNPRKPASILRSDNK